MQAVKLVFALEDHGKTPSGGLRVAVLLCAKGSKVAVSGNTAHHHVAMIIVRRVTALPPEAAVRKKFGVQFP